MTTHFLSMIGGSGVVPEIYSYHYDGKLSEGLIIPGQVGFLSSIKGPGFYKEFKYRPDGKLLEQTLKIPDWVTWKTSFEYRPDGSVLKKSTQITGLKHPEKSVDWTFGVDDLGRPSNLMIGSKLLLEYQYNDYSEIDRVVFSRSEERASSLPQGLARELGFGYDEWTQSRNKISKLFLNSSKTFDTTWSSNNRGLIEWETVNGINRTYVYSDPRGFLTLSDERGRSQEFEYDPTALITRVKDQSSSVDLMKDGDSQSLGSVRFQLDSSGRVSVAGSTYYSYNGLGRVGEIVSFPKSLIEYDYDEQGIRLSFKKASDFEYTSSRTFAGLKFGAGVPGRRITSKPD